MNNQERLSDILRRIDAVSAELLSLRSAVMSLELAMMEGNQEVDEQKAQPKVSPIQPHETQEGGDLDTQEEAGFSRTFDQTTATEYFADDFFERKEESSAMTMDEVVKPVSSEGTLTTQGHHLHLEPVLDQPSDETFAQVDSGTFSREDGKTIGRDAKNDVRSSGVDGRMKLEPLMSQFSVIDFFRYRDQLFGSDAEEMNRVVSEIEMLNSETELDRYLYDTLGWEPNDQDVIDFRATVVRYFE